MNYLKYFWITQLLSAILFIQSVGHARGGVRWRGPLWDFGFPTALFQCNAEDFNNAALSSQIFCFSEMPATYPDGRPKGRSPLGANRGIFLWENWSTIGGFTYVSCLEDYTYTFYFLPFNELLLPGYMPYYLQYRFWMYEADDPHSRVPKWKIVADYTHTSCNKFWDAVLVNLCYILFLSSALCYIGFSKTFTHHKIRWILFFIYTQLMVLHWLWNAFRYYQNYPTYGNTVPHFNWLFGLLETLNYIAILVFLACVLEWSWYGIKRFYFHWQNWKQLQNEG